MLRDNATYRQNKEVVAGCLIWQKVFGRETPVTRGGYRYEGCVKAEVPFALAGGGHLRLCCRGGR